MPNLTTRLLRAFARAEWVRIGLRERVVRALYRFAVDPQAAFETDFFGLKYRGRLDELIDWRVFFFGAHEKPLLRWLMGLADPQTEFVDIGANVGQHSMFMAPHVKRVIAFEPLTAVADVAARHFEANQLTNIVLVRRGLGAADSSMEFTLPERHNPGTGSFSRASNDAAAVRLEVQRGDSALEEVDVSRVSLVKVDVEGFEGEVLRGLRETLIRHRPVVVMEYSAETHRDLTGLDGLRRLLPTSYEILELQCNRPMLWLFNRPKATARPVSTLEPTRNLALCPTEKLSMVTRRFPG